MKKKGIIVSIGLAALISLTACGKETITVAETTAETVAETTAETSAETVAETIAETSAETVTETKNDETAKISNDHLIEETFTLDCKVQKSTGDYVYDTEINITVLLPSDYNENADESYATCYVLDGTSRIGKESDDVGLNALYENYAEDMPKIIYVGIDPPGSGAVRTAAYGAPYETTIFLTDINRAERFYLDGSGDYFFEWIADTVKPYIDGHYRTKADAADTGIMGFSSGGNAAMIAAMLESDTFTRVGAFSPATWIWSDWFYGVLENCGHEYKYTSQDGAERAFTVNVDKITNLFVYQGGQDGSSGYDDWATYDVSTVYDLMIEKGAGSDQHKYLFYKEGTHSPNAWKEHLMNCMITLFPDHIR